jgi:hypothetical protein
MIRQAHRYFVGAMSGATLIGIAIAVFVVLVSAQVFHAFPLGALTGHSGDSSVAPAKAVETADTGAAAEGTLGKANRAVVATTAAPTTTGATTAGHKAAPHGANDPAVAEANPTVAGDELGPGPVTETGSSTSSGTQTGSSSSGSTSSAGSNGSSGSSSSSSSSSSGSTSSSATASTAPKTSTTVKTGPVEVEVSAEPKAEGLDEAVVGSVKGTVGTLDEATGGTLSKTGVSGAVENVVESVAGPESVVGKTVNGLGEVVGGLLGGKKSE